MLAGEPTRARLVNSSRLRLFILSHEIRAEKYLLRSDIEIRHDNAVISISSVKGPRETTRKESNLSRDITRMKDVDEIKGRTPNRDRRLTMYARIIESESRWLESTRND